MALLDGKTGPTRLGCAVLLNAAQCDGRFPAGQQEVPAPVIAFVARQVGVQATAYRDYDWRGRTIEYHRAQIREYLGLRQTTVADAEAVSAWLVEQVLPYHHRLDHLTAVATDRFRALRLEPPTAKRLSRCVHAALHAYETRLFAATLARLTPETAARLDALVATGPGERAAASDAAHPEAAPTASPFATLRADPGPIGLESVAEEVAKLTTIRALDLPTDLFREVAPTVLAKYRQRAAAEWPRDLRAHAPALRATLLAAFCTLRAREITDALADLLIQIVHRIGVRAERRVDKELLDDFKRVAGKHGLLYRIAEASLDRPDEVVRAVIYPVVDEPTLRDLVKEYKRSGPAYRVRVHTIMRITYRHYYRRILPPILGALVFRSNNEVHQPVIRALDLPTQYTGSKARQFAEDDAVPLDGVAIGGVRDLVVDPETGRINRINYEIAVPHALREGLRCKEIWVEGADRYRNPDDDLPQDFDAQRTAYSAALHLPTEADQFIATLRRDLEAALTALDADLPTNRQVTLTAKGRLKVTPLSAQPEPPTIVRVTAELLARWPMTGLLDMLKEAELRIGFTRHFTSVAGKEALDRRELRKRLLLVLYGLGTNTGLRRVSGAELGVSYGDLRYVRRRFVTREALRAAIAELANAIFTPRLTAPLRPTRRGQAGTSWYVDETYLKVSGAWCSLYRAIDRDCALIDVRLSERRDMVAARFRAAHEEQRQSFRTRRTTGDQVSLGEQRARFPERWAELLGAVAAAEL